jgi:hypothetical protein
MQALSSRTGKWELIGYVALGDNGKLDPFSDENRAIVKPRACDMGGEAVTIASNASSENLFTTGSAVSYGILRHRESKHVAPKKFRANRELERASHRPPKLCSSRRSHAQQAGAWSLIKNVRSHGLFGVGGRASSSVNVRERS